MALNLRSRMGNALRAFRYDQQSGLMGSDGTRYYSPGPRSGSIFTNKGVRTTPRGGGMLAFGFLEWFADNYVPATICIAKRQEQIAAVNHAFQLRVELKDDVDPESAEVKRQIQAAVDYCDRDGGLDGPTSMWRTFTKKLIWEALSVDAIPVWRERDASGAITAHRLIRGATIAPRLDDNGWVPTPPAVAFQQYQDGVPAKDFNTNEMLYFVFNPRIKTPYGFPPCEALIYQILAWLHSEKWNVDFFRSGDLAEGYWQAPDDWTPEKMENFWNFIMRTREAQAQGDTRSPWIPVGPKWIPRRVRSDMQWEALQMKALSLTAALFGLNSASIGFAGEQYKVAQEGQIEMARRWGLVPMLLFIKEVIDQFLKDLGLDKVEFTWAPEQLDKLKLAQMISQVSPMVLSVNEARKLLGEDPVDGKFANCLYERAGNGLYVIYDPDRPGESYGIQLQMEKVGEEAGDGSNGKVPPQLEKAAKAAEEAAGKGDTDEDNEDEDSSQQDQSRRIVLPQSLSRGAQDDLRRWEQKALRMVNEDGCRVRFVSRQIPGHIQAAIRDRLPAARSADQVAEVFSQALDTPTNMTEALTLFQKMVDCEAGRLDGLDMLVRPR